MATRFATLSVHDLEQARRTWIEVLGLPEEPDIVLHTPEHEALWGLEGASRESFLLRAGDMFIEVVQYLDPVGKPWPEGYRITDLGLLNIALGLRSEDEHDQLIQRCIDAGIHPNSTKPTPLKKLWFAVYVNDPMGFSIELLYHSRAGQSQRVNPFNLLELGFAPTSAPVKRSQASAFTAAPPERVWEVLVDHEHMSQWSPFKSSKIVSPGSDGGQLGTVRKLSGGPGGLSLTETIVVAEEPYRLEYKAKGAPLQWKYHGFVTLEPTSGGGTTITWEAQFRSPVPGSGKITSATLRSLVKGLAGAAERAASTK